MIRWKRVLAGVASATALGAGLALATFRTELPKQPDIVQVGVAEGSQSTEATTPWRQPVMPAQDMASVGAASSSRRDGLVAPGGDDSQDNVRDGIEHDDGNADDVFHDDHQDDQDDHEDDHSDDEGGD